MSTVYRLKASELDSNILEEIKATFGDKEIEIIVSQFDETEYILKSTGNKNRLMRAIENVKERQNLLDLSGQILFSNDYDYNALRSYNNFKLAQVQQQKGELKFSSNINELRQMIEE